MSSDQTPGRIVVGVDSSPSSRAALAWAVHQARLTGASVEAVTAWHYPVMVGGVPMGPTGALDDSDYGEWAANALNQTVNQTANPDGPVKVSATVREAMPRRCCLTWPPGRTCWWSAAEGTAASLRPCLAQLARRVSIMRNAPS
jgi:hypothetical protein